MDFKALSRAVVGLTNRVFGTEVFYTPFGGSPVTITGVFSNAWLEVEGVVSLKPILRIKLDDLAVAPAKGDQAEIEATTYGVIECQVDGHGGATLILHKV